MVAAMQQMAAQGASAQAIQSQILAALNSAGAAPTPTQAAAIQTTAQQVATNQPVTAPIAPVTAGGSGMPSWLIYGLGAAALVMALAKPHKRSIP